MGSERNFGIVFAVVFAILGGFLAWKSSVFIWWPFLLSVLFLIIALAIPRILKYPNLLWFKFGMLLGAIVAPLVMALVYITTVVPVGLMIRLTGKDLLHLRLDPEADSYWIKRDEPLQPMKKQF